MAWISFAGIIISAIIGGYVVIQKNQTVIKNLIRKNQTVIKDLKQEIANLRSQLNNMENTNK